MEQNSVSTNRKSAIIGSIVILSSIILMAIFIPQLVPNDSQTGEYEDISVSTAYEMINDTITYPDLIILDVRTQSEYDSEHLNNSILIPVEELELRLDELDGYNTTEIIVYCRSGNRSRTASNILSTNGFAQIFNMLGGISAWTQAGYLTVS